MKKNVLFLAFGLFMMMMTQVSFGQHIAGSPHDFSTQSWNTTNEICIVCHVPHNANTSVVGAPLWNHSVSSVTNYQVYSSPTFNTLVPTLGQPDGSSKLCLSCHDGTVGLEDFGGVKTSNNLMGTLYPQYNRGTNLTGDHPISFVYNTALATAAGTRLYDPSVALSGITSSGTIQNDLLQGNELECSSCHDVHNHYGQPNLLVKSNAGSALCLTCHNK